MSDKVDKPKTPGQTKHVPKDAQVIMSVMKDMGITDYEPRVINQLLEFTYRYVTCVLDDARVFANHAKKKLIDLDDVRLAVQMQLDKAFTTPPPREVLLEVARSKNISPLPLIKPHCGLRLPPDRYCLSACNYRLKLAKKQYNKALVGNATNKVMNSKPNAHQNLILKRQATLVTVSKTQSVNVPKPVLKFTTGNKVIAKPAIRVTSSSSAQQSGNSVKVEVDMEGMSSKRKRDDEDYDVM